MKTVATLLALAALAVSACAPEGELADSRPEPTPPFHFNITALPAPLQESVTAGAEEWNALTGETLIVIDPEGPHRAVLGAVSGDGVEGASRSDNWVWTIRFEPGQENGPASCRLWFARHAFGHVLEARFPDNVADTRHSPLNSDAMFPVVNCGGLLTARDVAAIRW